MNLQFRLALRYLWGRKLRTTLTTLAIAFGVMVLFGLNSMIPALMSAFRQNMLASAGQVDLAVTSVSAGTFDGARVDDVRAVAGVVAATGSLQQAVQVPASLVPTAAATGQPVVSTVVVVGLDPASAQAVRAYPLAAGRFLAPDDGDVILLPQNLADRLGLAVGDRFTLPAASGRADFEIVGLLTTRPLPGSDEVIVPLAAAQALLDQPGQINLIEAVFSADADPDQVTAAVLERLGSNFRAGELEVGTQLLATVEMGQFAMGMFGVMALAMGAFIIFNTFRTVVAERRRDLGMLRAVGASRRTILGLILSESLLQGVFGVALGLAGGYLIAAGLVALIRPIMMDYLHFTLGHPIITAGNLVGSIVLGLGFTLLGGLAPALSAARVAPLDALRPTVAEVYERTARRRGLIGAALILLAALALLTGKSGLAGAGTLLFLAGLVLVAPALVQPVARIFGRLLGLLFAREGRVAEGNIARQPGRAAVTASVMMISLATVIALAGMLSSIFDAFLGYLDVSLGADFLVMPSSLVLSGGNVGAGPELAAQVRQTPGVRDLTSLRLGYASLEDGTALQVVGIDPATYPAIAGLEFSAGDADEAFAALGRERALIVNGIFSAQNRVRPGDTLTLLTPEGPQDYRVAGVGLDYLNAKLSTAYISQDNLARDFHQTSDLLLLVELADGADAATTRQALQALVDRYPAFTLLDWASFRQAQERTFNSASAMLYVLMVMFALPALLAMVNTLAINVIERTREIGVLRAVGSTQRQIQRMVMAESLLLAALGIACGILAGLWLGYVLVLAMNAGGFVLRYFFPTAGVLAGVAVGLLVGVLAALIPARQAARMDIVAALRYE